LAITQRRDEQIAAFYGDQAERLAYVVRRRVDPVGDEIIENACHTTWT
jgi:hypothetical protein